MREILFRGKRIDNGEWVYGNYAFTDVNGKKYFIFQNKPLEHEVIPETVGQYTGLTDTNGKKIFEGDILEFSEDYDDKFGYPAINYCKCIVIYDESLLAWRIRGLDYEGLDDLCEYVDSEIIGNIHDNPELLNKKENDE